MKLFSLESMIAINFFGFFWPMHLKGILKILESQALGL